ncbi:hypothetical protein [Roseateles toxinivorans]|uniref:Flp pilus assembly protein CpaB n=1 Tax=Roseateles toxinivorans TaxID=270368 RepID=A0A4R6QQB0_9BURK|nr:hypothetical protein [Roseateles toxinivorans]TDP73090.1 hypothetical protein DES47_102836 [Roseateles toxinivorans]
MNTTAKTLIQALIAGAVLAAAGWMLKPATPAPDMQVVQLERVVITGKRMQEGVQEQRIAQLPRVVITGKRLPAEGDTMLAQAPRAAAAKI